MAMTDIYQISKQRSRNDLPEWKRQKGYIIDTLAGMAKKADKPSALFILDRMAIQEPPIADIAELAKKSGVDYFAIDKWIRYGQIGRYENLSKVANALKCTVSQLFKHPRHDTEEEVFSGIPEPNQRHIRGLIEFERSRARGARTK
jgi:hypothetical protein